jgi:pantoate--beta-alanine ligase
MFNFSKMNKMIIFKKIKDIQSHIKSLKNDGKSIALVPTMGSLHKGHLSLINDASSEADIVVVSIFVNEKQFDDIGDFKKYPKDFDKDVQALKNSKVDILFYPNLEEIYPTKNLINFKLNKLADNLCGKARGSHFQGVMLIISKLFNIINPDYAVFGEKDFQQLQIIRRLSEDLSFNVKIIPSSIFREESGLAMSSRNNRLSPSDLVKAGKVNKIVKQCKDLILASQDGEIVKILQKTNDKLLQYFDKVDYLEVCDEDNLQIISKFDQDIKSRIFVAVYLGQVRLIDNIELY